MAGSIKWVVYTSDEGSQYAAKLDESNAEAGGFDDYDALADYPPLPKGMQMRYINALDPASGAKRKVYVGKPTDELWTGAVTLILLTLLGSSGLASALTTFQVVSAVGEKFRRPVPFDTGLLDGDAN